jgi:hypothetical protein
VTVFVLLNSCAPFIVPAQSIEKARKALQGTTEDHWMMPWRFVMGGKLLYEMPRQVMLTGASVILLTIVGN